MKAAKLSGERFRPPRPIEPRASSLAGQGVVKKRAVTVAAGMSQRARARQVPLTGASDTQPGRAPTPTSRTRKAPAPASRAQLALDFDEGKAGAAASAVATPETTALSTARRARRARTVAREVRLPEPEAPRAADEERLEGAVAALMPPGKRLSLHLNENHYTMISVRRRTDGYVVRAHRMFASAEPRLVRAIARYVVHNDPRASQLIGEHIERNQHVIKDQPKRRRQVVLRPAGRHHDLQAIFDRLNRERFGRCINAQITWGPASTARRPQKSIKMGSYSIEDRIIRIHPLLDRPDVPEYFVAWIVFHEMLHDKHMAVRKGARRCYHTREFTAEERSFREYDRAHAWERQNIDRLLAG